MFQLISTVFRKELLDFSRDRRTITMTILSALFSGPLVLGLMFGMMNSQLNETKEVKLAVVGQEHAPALMEFLQRYQVVLTAAPADYEAAIKRGDLPVVLKIPADFPAQVDGGETATVEVYQDASRWSDNSQVQTVMRLLRSYNQQWGELRLLARGVATTVGKPMQIEAIDLATPQQSGAHLLFMLGYYGLFSALLGGIAISIDTTAGERERQSLEPLLSLPVRALDLVIGKWLAGVCCCTVVVFCTLLGFYLSLQWLPMPKVGVPFQLGWLETLEIFGILLPMVFFYPSILLLLGSLSKSFREAQTSLSFVFAAISMLPLLNIYFQDRTFWGIQFLPISSQFHLITKVLRGDAMTLIDWTMASVFPLLAAGFLIFLFARRLQKEAILVGR